MDNNDWGFVLPGNFDIKKYYLLCVMEEGTSRQEYEYWLEGKKVLETFMSGTEYVEEPSDNQSHTIPRLPLTVVIVSEIFI